MTDTPGPRIMYLEGSQEVLGGASERCPVPPAGSTGGPAQADGAGRPERDETDCRGWDLRRGPRHGSPVDAPIPTGRRSSAGPKTSGPATGTQAHGSAGSGCCGADRDLLPRPAWPAHVLVDP